jgi:hypothetical protein
MHCRVGDHIAVVELEARKINQWVRLHYIIESLLLINSNYSEISNKLLGLAQPNNYMSAPPLPHSAYRMSFCK